jgi:hypothetical protein
MEIKPKVRANPERRLQVVELVTADTGYLAVWGYGWMEPRLRRAAVRAFGNH